MIKVLAPLTVPICTGKPLLAPPKRDFSVLAILSPTRLMLPEMAVRPDPPPTTLASPVTKTPAAPPVELETRLPLAAIRIEPVATEPPWTPFASPVWIGALTVTPPVKLSNWSGARSVWAVPPKLTVMLPDPRL